MYSRRKRVAAEQAAAQAGKNLWADKVPPEARMKFAFALRDLVDGLYEDYDRWDLIAEAHKAVLRDLGIGQLRTGGDRDRDFFDSLVNSPEDRLHTA